jgi:hypothetical protein
VMRSRLSQSHCTGFGECPARVGVGDAEAVAEAVFGAQDGVVGLPGMVRVGELDANGLPLPVEQLGDLKREAGEAPVVRDDVAGPEAVWSTVERGDDGACDALDGDSVPEPRADDGQLRRRSPRWTFSTRKHSRTSEPGP